MSDSGWIPAHRKMYDPDHWLAPSRRDPSNKRDAWLDLCQLAQHRRRSHAGITLDRGQVLVATREMAKRWGWSKSRVSRFLTDLRSRNMIGTVSGTPLGTVYNIVTYDVYAVVDKSERDTSGDTERDSSGTAAGQEQQLKHLNNPHSARARDFDPADPFAGLPPLTAKSIQGLYGGNGTIGTDERAWGNIHSPEERERILGIAVTRWRGEDCPTFNGRFFRKILTTVIDEQLSPNGNDAGPKREPIPLPGGGFRMDGIIR